MEARLCAALEPIAGSLDPRTLARCSCTCRALRGTLADVGAAAFWSAAGRAAGTPQPSLAALEAHYTERGVWQAVKGALMAEADPSAADLDLWGIAGKAVGTPQPDRAALAFLYANRGVWCSDATFGCKVASDGAHLKLGSGRPESRRVAAACAVVGLTGRGRAGVDVTVAEYEPHGKTVLWLGIVFSHDGRRLDRGTLDAALSGYDDPSVQKGSVRDNFSTGEWSMAAIGSNGTSWASGNVERLSPPREFRFGAGDTVRLTVDTTANQLLFAVGRWNDGKLRFVRERGVRRLVPRNTQPGRLYVIAHLSDISAPSPSNESSAVVALGEWQVER